MLAARYGWVFVSFLKQEWCFSLFTLIAGGSTCSKLKIITFWSKIEEKTRMKLIYCLRRVKQPNFVNKIRFFYRWMTILTFCFNAAKRLSLIELFNQENDCITIEKSSHTPKISSWKKYLNTSIYKHNKKRNYFLLIINNG